MTLTQSKTATTLSESDVSAVTGELQAELADLIDLSLKAKQAHWNIVGPNFRPIHLQLDEIVNDLRLWTDTVAERMSTMGVYPDGRTDAVLSGTTFREMPAGEIKDTLVIDLFTDYLGELAAKSRERSDRAASDPVTQNILQDIVAGVEKHQWMLRAQSQ